MADSHLVKRIKKLEKKAKKASDFDKNRRTSLGMASSALDGIYEIVHEVEFEIAEKEKEEEADKDEDEE